MGTMLDMKERKEASRIDDDDRKGRIRQARDLIYQKRTAVDGKAVEELLKVDSLVPISVMNLFLQLISC